MRVANVAVLLAALLGAGAGLAHAARGSSRPTPAAVAAAVNLRAADLRGVLGLQPSRSAVSRDADVEVFPKACRGADVRASGSSVSFALGDGSNGFPLISSTVLVGRSAESARRDLAAFRTRAFAHCFAAKLLSPRRLARWTALPAVALDGGGDAAGWRFAAGPPDAVSVAFTMFVVGRDQVFLETVGSRPLAASARERLLSLLAARALANPH